MTDTDPTLEPALKIASVLKSTSLPSTVRDRYWIESVSPVGNWAATSGKWLLFIPVGRIDKVWKVIDRETRLGRLGIATKVATAKSNSRATNRLVRVICVYTYDSTDLEDVHRVRRRLRELGFVKKISYKTDAATIDGKYSQNGDKKISLLYE